MNNGTDAAKAWFGRSALTTLVLIAVAGLLLSCDQETTAPVPGTGQHPPAGENVTAVEVEQTTRASASSAHADQPQLSQSTISGGSSGGTGGSFGSFHLSPAPQTATNDMAPAQGGLTVSAVGSATRSADEAYVVMIPEQRYGPSGPEQLSDDDRDDIVENLGELDIPETDIAFDFQGRYGATTIAVAVEPDEIADEHEEILEAVEEVIRRFEAQGLRFALNASNCEQALSDARREAAPAAEDTADDLAEALGVERGAVIGALEDRSVNYQTFALTNTDYDACATPASAPYYQLLPFDADPEVEVSVSLHVTYVISAAATPSATSQ